jgi:hypothetical protein
MFVLMADKDKELTVSTNGQGGRRVGAPAVGVMQLTVFGEPAANGRGCLAIQQPKEILR